MTAWLISSFLVIASAQTPPQTPPPQTPPVTPPTAGRGAQPAAPAVPPSPYTFPTGAGMFIFYVKPDKAADFDGVLTRIAEVLDKSQDPARKSQAVSWRIYKSMEPAKEERVYVFTFDPASSTVDYDLVKLLSEAAPADAQGLFDRMKDDVVRVERMGLTKIR
jgi:hypothetical protein